MTDTVSTVGGTTLRAARRMRDGLVTLRHELHADPEIGLELPRTRQKVLDALDGLPLEIRQGSSCTSVTAVLRGTHSDDDAPVVLLRADMDALPVHEEIDVAYRFRTDGVMHACGHDLHTAMLVGAARLLADRRDELAGDVVLMFQPGEENFDGARHMIDEGVLDAAGRPVTAAYGLHVFSADLEPGEFATRPGTLMSATDEVHVTITGRGGHGSMPHLAADPVPAVAELVTALQTMVTRRFDVFDPVVLTVGSLHAGTKANVVPETARLEATLRTFSAATRDRCLALVDELARGIATAHGVRADVEVVTLYPVTENDPDEAALLAATVATEFGPDRFRHLANPLACSEDFSKVLQHVPGCFAALGARPAALPAEAASYNHSAHAQFSDDVLPDGAALLAALALRRSTGRPDRART